MLEILASILYFPAVLVNLIGLLLGFVFMQNLSSFSIIHTAENLVFQHYSYLTRRIHLPKHRTPRQFTPSICFMGGIINCLYYLSHLYLNDLLLDIYRYLYFIMSRRSAVDVRHRRRSLYIREL